MSGYQETLTDPSYYGQVVVATAPHIGNTGWNDEDDESSRIWVAGYVVRDPAPTPSNWRASRTLDDELVAQSHRGHQRYRHPRADTAPARPGGHAGGYQLGQHRCGRAAHPGASPPQDGGCRSGGARHLPGALRGARSRPAACHGGRDRLGHQGEHATGTGRARCRGARAAGVQHRRRCLRHRPRRGLLQQRPW